MVRRKEGFEGERLISLSERELEKYAEDPFIGNLYLRKIGFLPHAKYHFVSKEKGCDYYILLYCVNGKGWYQVHGKRHSLHRNQFVILPAHVPHSYGADDADPWSLYWIHFRGKMASQFMMPNDEPGLIEPSEKSRIQVRINIFEELYHSFTFAYLKKFMQYTSSCLYLFLSTFTLLEPFRHVNFQTSDKSFSAKVSHYMLENIHEKLTLHQLASYFHYSSSHFSMLFRKETGASPIDYFLRLKIQKACQYIELSDMKLYEISTALGFESPTYFSRLFTKYMGIPPTAYRLREKS